MGTDVFIFGGRQGTAIDEKLLNDVYKFDTLTCTWTRVPVSGTEPCPRSYLSLVSHGKCLYVFGGCPQEGRLADLHSLDTESGVWTRLEAGPMEGRGGTPLAVTRDGDIFVVGGFAGREMADIHKYSIKEGKWTTMKEVLLIERKTAAVFTLHVSEFARCS